MSLSLKTILLGVALAAATPIAHNATLSQRSAASLEAILPNGLAPIHMAEVVDPQAELEKCNFDEYADCKNRRRRDCDDIVDNSSDCELGPLIKVIGI
ncbi:hypothetical protein J7T55_002507 [Diaporthe amygdali]|uniref:uncharacterized protein n=1 Tax=Phomopsis amygdali TaxID=1214568 RepID=UPI0022FEBEA8|nr:uncharacterized protein J7T55_002507 [Diaporthe amygdali]KAJ0121996.1 hypothetical protein J7T55_002507 [Diaporthe amygdali]